MSQVLRVTGLYRLCGHFISRYMHRVQLFTLLLTIPKKSYAIHCFTPWSLTITSVFYALKCINPTFQAIHETLYWSIQYVSIELMEILCKCGEINTNIMFKNTIEYELEYYVMLNLQAQKQQHKISLKATSISDFMLSKI